jgi:predicted RNase H-like HicB family nuclease
MNLSAVITTATEGGYIATNIETGTTSQGESVDEAIANLKEATELYLEEFPLKVAVKTLFTHFEVTASAA